MRVSNLIVKFDMTMKLDNVWVKLEGQGQSSKFLGPKNCFLGTGYTICVSIHTSVCSEGVWAPMSFIPKIDFLLSQVHDQSMI